MIFGNEIIKENNEEVELIDMYEYMLESVKKEQEFFNEFIISDFMEVKCLREDMEYINEGFMDTIKKYIEKFIKFMKDLFNKFLSIFRKQTKDTIAKAESVKKDLKSKKEEKSDGVKIKTYEMNLNSPIRGYITNIESITSDLMRMNRTVRLRNNYLPYDEEYIDELRDNIHDTDKFANDTFSKSKEITISNTSEAEKYINGIIDKEKDLNDLVDNLLTKQLKKFDDYQKDLIDTLDKDEDDKKQNLENFMAFLPKIKKCVDDNTTKLMEYRAKVTKIYNSQIEQIKAMK